MTALKLNSTVVRRTTQWRSRKEPYDIIMKHERKQVTEVRAFEKQPEVDKPRANIRLQKIALQKLRPHPVQTQRIEQVRKKIKIRRSPKFKKQKLFYLEEYLKPLRKQTLAPIQHQGQQDTNSSISLIFSSRSENRLNTQLTDRGDMLKKIDEIKIQLKQLNEIGFFRGRHLAFEQQLPQQIRKTYLHIKQNNLKAFADSKPIQILKMLFFLKEELSSAIIKQYELTMLQKKIKLNKPINQANTSRYDLDTIKMLKPQTYLRYTEDLTKRLGEIQNNFGPLNISRQAVWMSDKIKQFQSQIFTIKR